MCMSYFCWVCCPTTTLHNTIPPRPRSGPPLCVSYFYWKSSHNEQYTTPFHLGRGWSAPTSVGKCVCVFFVEKQAGRPTTTLHHTTPHHTIPPRPRSGLPLCVSYFYRKSSHNKQYLTPFHLGRGAAPH